MFTRFLCKIGIHEPNRIRDQESEKDFCSQCGKPLPPVSGPHIYDWSIEDDR